MDEIAARLAVLNALFETLAAHTLADWPQARFNAFSDAVLHAFQLDDADLRGPDSARRARMADLADETLLRIRERRAILLRRGRDPDAGDC